jgi:hypothetical protein
MLIIILQVKLPRPIRSKLINQDICPSQEFEMIYDPIVEIAGAIPNI